MNFTHPRTTWQDPTLPVVGPKMYWPSIIGVAIHYTAAVNLIDGDPGENPALLPAYMRAIQRDYNNRKPTGYSIGYNAAVDWRGETWECRGFDIKCAAHAPLNEEYNAILMLVDGASRCTDEAAESVRQIIAEMENRAGRPLAICGHGRLPGGKPTACPGAGLLAQVAEGVFSPRYQPETPRPPDKITDPAPTDPDPSTLEDTMLKYRDKRFANVFLINGGVTTTGGNLAAAVPGVIVTDIHDQSLISYMRASHLTMAEMVAAGPVAGEAPYPPFNPPDDLR